MSNIIQGNCLDVMKTIASNSIDNIFTDPPYALGSTLLAGLEVDLDIIGIELNPEYVEIAKARYEYHLKKNTPKQIKLSL